MVAANPASFSKSVPVSDLCVLCVSVFSSPNLSPFNFKLLALFTLSLEGSVVEGSTFNSVSLSPFPATLASSLQITEKSATLSPAFATLTSHVKHKFFVCHSYKKHPGVGCPSISANSLPSALKSTRALPSTNPFAAAHHPPHCFSFFHQSPVTIHQSQVSKSFTIRTYAKCVHNPFRMNTSKIQDLKLFRINTYEKTGGGVPPLRSG
jgi:hypothetical protein